MNEFGLIARYFAPLASSFPGSLNLTDDAALINIPAGQQLVVTKDAIVEGVHFIGNENPSLIARKLLRTNLSDLAAMGAAPLCYFLALMVPKDTPSSWFADFTSGLAHDQAEFHIPLAGGDTTATHGPLALSLTAMGTVPTGSALKRSDANIGDDIYVSGTLGDSALGLTFVMPVKAGIYVDPGLRRDDTLFLINRYQLPEPRLALGQQLRSIANSCIDISDGLLQDMQHICTASGVGATIERARLPLSEPAAALLKNDPALWEKIVAGGDDYELLFTAAPIHEAVISAFNMPVTKIGKIIAGNNVQLMDEQGAEIIPDKKGFRHF